MARRTTVLILATAVILGGCGGGSSGELSNQQYAAKLDQYLKPVSQEFLRLQTVAHSPTVTKPQLSSAMSTANTSLQTASQKIGALKPPSAAASLNADLVSAILTFQKTVAQTEQTISSGTASQIKAQVAVFKAAGARYISTLKKLKGEFAAQGVKVGKTG